MDRRYFSKIIVEWYQLSKRNLPWRVTTDPYKIWLSEIILQQTRVNQGLPYYERFVATYPSISSLAKASEQEVLRLWQGLGYYTRARNLHKCAKLIHENFKGSFPDNYHALKSLPGIGDYTAAAIASFAFGEPVAVLDGNAFRVLARIFGIDEIINSSHGKAHFTKLANELIPQDYPDIYNQAIMEFGATFCVPVNPPCEECIFKTSCYAFKNTLQAFLPVKQKARVSRKRYFHYLVFKKGNSLLMRKRTAKDIWLGLYDFPLIEQKKRANLKKILVGALSLQQIVDDHYAFVSEPYKHILSHQTIYTRFVVIPWSAESKWDMEEGKFYSMKKIAELPKPVLISRFLKDYSF